MVFRSGSFHNWRRKKPKEGQTFAKPTHCLSEHYHRSGLEARVCDELRLRKKANDIRSYIREVPFELVLEGCKLGRYYADFVVENHDGTTEIIDAKGIQFPLFKQKWKIMETMFRNNPNVTLRIVTR